MVARVRHIRFPENVCVVRVCWTLYIGKETTVITVQAVIKMSGMTVGCVQDPGI